MPKNTYVLSSSAEKLLFIEAFGLGEKDVVCLVGAGGKTSLMFQLAGEARSLGYRTLVSTTTKIFVPEQDQYDAIDLNGRGFTDSTPEEAGIYVAGKPVSTIKMSGLSEDILSACVRQFDLTLLEADGAARKPLKGWLQTEPVIPAFTTHTIGIIDIQTVGKIVTDDLVHRLDCFCKITGARKGDRVTTDHLVKIIFHEQGLFFHAMGKRIVYINKVESHEDLYHAKELKALLPGCTVCSGSVKLKKILSHIQNI